MGRKEEKKCVINMEKIVFIFLKLLISLFLSFIFLIVDFQKKKEPENSPFFLSFLRMSSSFDYRAHARQAIKERREFLDYFYLLSSYDEAERLSAAWALCSFLEASQVAYLGLPSEDRGAAEGGAGPAEPFPRS